MTPTANAKRILNYKSKNSAQNRLNKVKEHTKTTQRRLEDSKFDEVYRNKQKERQRRSRLNKKKQTENSVTMDSSEGVLWNVLMFHQALFQDHLLIVLLLYLHQGIHQDLPNFFLWIVLLVTLLLWLVLLLVGLLSGFLSRT